MLGLLRLWLLWRLMRLAVPLLFVVVLLAALDRQAHHPALPAAPRAAAPLIRVAGRDAGTMLANARRQLTDTLRAHLKEAR